MSNVRAWLSGGHVHFLQLATRLTEVTRRHAPSRHRSRRCLLLACCKVQLVAQSDSPRVRARCCWAIISGFLRRDTIAGGTEHAVGMPRDAVFPILQRLVDADFAAVEIGFYAQCWSCFSELDVGWSEPLLFIFNRQNELRESQTGAEVTLSDIRLAVETMVETLWHFLLLAYIFKGHINNIRKWLFIFENIIERYNTMFKN